MIPAKNPNITVEFLKYIYTYIHETLVGKWQSLLI